MSKPDSPQAVVAVDPGADGATAVVSLSGAGTYKLHAVGRIRKDKDHWGLATLALPWLDLPVDGIERVRLVVESQGSFGGKTSRKSAITIGRNLEMLLNGLRRRFCPFSDKKTLPPYWVRPQVWQKAMFAWAKGDPDAPTDTKDLARDTVFRDVLLDDPVLHGSFLKSGPNKGRLHDGAADAICIALWAAKIITSGGDLNETCSRNP